MEVVDKQQTALSNAEVLQVLQEAKGKEAKKPKHSRVKHLNTILYETSKYLRSTPAGRQSDGDAKEVIRRLEPFKLTAAETLQVLNLRPTSAVEIQLLIEECEERFSTEEKLDQLVSIISETLPARPSSSNENPKNS